MTAENAAPKQQRPDHNRRAIISSAIRIWTVAILGTAVILSFVAWRGRYIPPKTTEFKANLKIWDPIYNAKAFPPRTEFSTEPIFGKHDVADTELVLGVEINGESRAYPINMLTGPSREVFNDTLGDTNVVVTWCHLCHFGVVYLRDVQGKTLTFFVSGRLYYENLVMRDRETDSEWSHMMGQARSGPMNGALLEMAPSLLTTWALWKERHPQTDVVVLDRTVGLYKQALYDNDEFFSRLVVGLVMDGKASVWTYKQLMASPLRNEVHTGSPVLIYFDQAAKTPLAYRRQLDDRQLTFELRGKAVHDQETDSRWDMRTGRAVEGPLQGKQLKLLPAITSDAEHWKVFFGHKS